MLPWPLRTLTCLMNIQYIHYTFICFSLKDKFIIIDLLHNHTTCEKEVPPKFRKYEHLLKKFSGKKIMNILIIQNKLKKIIIRIMAKKKKCMQLFFLSSCTFAHHFSPVIPQGINLEHFMSTKYLSNIHENKRYKIMIDM